MLKVKEDWPGCGEHSSEQEFAKQFIKRLVLAWDPNFTKLTPEERKRLMSAGFCIFCLRKIDRILPMAAIRREFGEESVQMFRKDASSNLHTPLWEGWGNKIIQISQP